MAHTIYENFILANKVSDILTTQVDLNAYMTVDTELAENAGMKKVINTYTATGNVEDLAMGEGNSEDIEVGFTSAEYTVGTTQGRFKYYDEQEMTDPMVVDVGLDGIAKTMVNDFTTKAIAEYEKATVTHAAGAWTFETIVDAIANMNVEDESALFLLINPAERHLSARMMITSLRRWVRLSITAWLVLLLVSLLLLARLFLLILVIS